ncbi:MAG: ribosomal RNA small subunit methyltransferase A [Fretibacterium sp.]|nr:ribosomal RNA small subunit methyltransferase A [Fretibacterium sp.]
MKRFAASAKTTGFRPRKRLGQNFLIDRQVLSCIVERAQIQSSDVLLEIGPGQGVLTKALLETDCSFLHAVELDSRLKDTLEALSRQDNRLSLVWGDAMKVDYGALAPFPTKVVANIPYNITTPLIWKLLRFAPRGLCRHLYMVQKEAAERMLAAPDTKERYPLGIALEVMGSVSMVRRVPPGCFRPAPRVDSAIVEIILTRNFHLMRDSLWSDLLHIAFAQRRKTLLNNLKGFQNRGAEVWEVLLREIGVDPRTRAEDLSGNEWIRLHSRLRDEASCEEEMGEKPCSSSSRLS